jgi:hypothetical protein
MLCLSAQVRDKYEDEIEKMVREHADRGALQVGLHTLNIWRINQLYFVTSHIQDMLTRDQIESWDALLEGDQVEYKTLHRDIEMDKCSTIDERFSVYNRLTLTHESWIKVLLESRVGDGVVVEHIGFTHRYEKLSHRKFQCDTMSFFSDSFQGVVGSLSKLLIDDLCYSVSKKK